MQVSSHVVLDEARLGEAVKYFLTQPGFSFDYEAQGKQIYNIKEKLNFG